MKKRYDNNGYLIVSELDSCPLWERDKIPGCPGCEHDCFYCVFSNFRQGNFIKSITGVKSEPIYSICHNEQNKSKVKV